VDHIFGKELSVRLLNKNVVAAVFCERYYTH